MRFVVLRDCEITIPLELKAGETIEIPDRLVNSYPINYRVVNRYLDPVRHGVTKAKAAEPVKKRRGRPPKVKADDGG